MRRLLKRIRKTIRPQNRIDLIGPADLRRDIKMILHPPDKLSQKARHSSARQLPDVTIGKDETDPAAAAVFIHTVENVPDKIQIPRRPGGRILRKQMRRLVYDQ